MSFLLGDFIPYIVAAVSALAAVGYAYFKGATNEKTKQTIRKAEADEKTHKRIDDVDPPSDHDDVVKRLRRLGQ